MLLFNTLSPDPRVWKEARTLSRHGYDVQILAIRRKGQEREEGADGFSVLRIFPGNPYGLKPWKVLPTWYEVLSFIHNRRREPFDFCHCHDAEPLRVGYWLAKHDGAKLIYDAHEYFQDFMPHRGMDRLTGLRHTLYHRYVRVLNEARLISKADGVITVSESIASLLKQTYHLKREPVSLLNTLPYLKVRRSSLLRDMFHLADHEVILLFQGAISEDRQVDRVIRLLGRLDTRIVFVLLGQIDRAYEQRLKRLAGDLGVAHRVYFGEVPHGLLLEAAASADIGIYLIEAETLSYRFSLPNKFFEYIAAELPVVVGRLPEMERIVDRYQCGFAVSPSDSEKVVQVIHRMVENRALYRRMKGNTRKAKKELCWEREAPKLIRLYNEMG